MRSIWPRHFGNPATTVFGGDRYLALFLPGDMTGIRYPDMMIAFDADPEAYDRSNGYIISEQGKPPDFVLEIGSPPPGAWMWRRSGTTMRLWAYPSTGASTRQVGATARVWPGTVWRSGVYRPIAIEALEEDILQGRSAVLHLDLRWEHGQLKWHDPETGRHIATYDDQVTRAEGAEARAEGAEARAEKAEVQARQEREERVATETELRAERQARAALEARVRELEAQFRRPGS